MLSMKTVALSVFVWLAAGSVAFADVQLSFRDGHVSIVARDATVGQILAEWAKIGQTKIVNVERIPRAPLTIELENVTESRALDVVLRTVGGYMTASRAIDVPNASRFDRIILMTTSTAVPASAAPRAARVSAPPEYQSPAYSQPPASPEPPASSQPPAYSQPQSAFEPPPPAEDSAADVTYEAPPQTETGATATLAIDPRAAAARDASRGALEVIDPRTFRLPQVQGGVTAVPSTSARPGGGVAAPGMIAQPKPR
jgi:hypothetical protein